MDNESKLIDPINPVLLVLGSLSYCYFLAMKIPRGSLRLLPLVPIFYIFSTLPWHFGSPFGRAMSSFFVTWLTSFKLLLFCFDRGPLLSHQNFIDFVLISLFPLKIRKPNDDVSRPRHSLRARVSRYELVAISNQPYLATSLQDFWGKRWNRMSSDILRQTVYDPTRDLLSGRVGHGGAKMAATVATLVVSGIMHEMVLYYITCGRKPTWEVACFFVLHGLCMAVETGLKRSGRVKMWAPVHPVVSVVLTVGFALATSYWLLLLPVWRNSQRGCR